MMKRGNEEINGLCLQKGKSEFKIRQSGNGHSQLVLRQTEKLLSRFLLQSLLCSDYIYSPFSQHFPYCVLVSVIPKHSLQE